MKINWKKLNEMESNKTNPYQDVVEFIKKDEYNKQTKLIEVINLKHQFKKKVIYHNISFEIFGNERLAFLGPNGAGKTLTISTICGIYKPKEGTIKYNFDYKTKPYEKISVQFQDLQFPSALSAKDLIDFCLELQEEPESEEDIFEALKVFELDEIVNLPMSKLSGGQQQRVNVFLSMLGKPKVLILDEFTTGLDISIKNKIQNYILEYCNKNQTTLVIISHDVDCIETMVDRIILLADQRILADSYTKDIINEFGSVKNFLKKYIIT